jgi:hypothetical protein
MDDQNSTAQEAGNDSPTADQDGDFQRRFNGLMSAYQKTKAERDGFAAQLATANEALSAFNDEDAAPAPRIDANSPRKQQTFNPREATAAELRAELLSQPVPEEWGRPRSGIARVPIA